MDEHTASMRVQEEAKWMQEENIEDGDASSKMKFTATGTFQTPTGASGVLSLFYSSITDLLTAPC